MFVLAFVKNQMSSFQMESLKVMEKFDGGNFQLWKFKMRMMLSKHGLWKFVDGTATISNDEDQITNYNKKATKAFTLLCEHLTDASCTHSILRKCQKCLGDTLRCARSQDYRKQVISSKEDFSPSKCKKGKTYLCTST